MRNARTSDFRVGNRAQFPIAADVGQAMRATKVWKKVVQQILEIPRESLHQPKTVLEKFSGDPRLIQRNLYQISDLSKIFLRMSGIREASTESPRSS